MISITEKRYYQNNPNLQSIFPLWVSVVLIIQDFTPLHIVSVLFCNIKFSTLQQQ